jgi:hypothetical protein
VQVFTDIITDGITVGFKQGRVIYTDRIVDTLTDEIISLVNPLVIFNI